MQAPQQQALDDSCAGDLHLPPLVSEKQILQVEHLPQVYKLLQPKWTRRIPQAPNTARSEKPLTKRRPHAAPLHVPCSPPPRPALPSRPCRTRKLDPLHPVLISPRAKDLLRGEHGRCTALDPLESGGFECSKSDAALVTCLSMSGDKVAHRDHHHACESAAALQDAAISERACDGRSPSIELCLDADVARRADKNEQKDVPASEQSLQASHSVQPSSKPTGYSMPCLSLLLPSADDSDGSSDVDTCSYVRAARVVRRSANFLAHVRTASHSQQQQKISRLAMVANADGRTFSKPSPQEDTSTLRSLTRHASENCIENCAETVRPNTNSTKGSDDLLCITTGQACPLYAARPSSPETHNTNLSEYKELMVNHPSSIDECGCHHHPPDSASTAVPESARADDVDPTVATTSTLRSLTCNVAENCIEKCAETVEANSIKESDDLLCITTGQACPLYAARPSSTEGHNTNLSACKELMVNHLDECGCHPHPLDSASTAVPESARAEGVDPTLVTEGTSHTEASATLVADASYTAGNGCCDKICSDEAMHCSNIILQAAIITPCCSDVLSCPETPSSSIGHHGQNSEHNMQPKDPCPAKIVSSKDKPAKCVRFDETLDEVLSCPAIEGSSASQELAQLLQCSRPSWSQIEHLYPAPDSDTSSQHSSWDATSEVPHATSSSCSSVLEAPQKPEQPGSVKTETRQLLQDTLAYNDILSQASSSDALHDGPHANINACSSLLGESNQSGSPSTLERQLLEDLSRENCSTRQCITSGGMHEVLHSSSRSGSSLLHASQQPERAGSPKTLTLHHSLPDSSSHSACSSIPVQVNAAQQLARDVRIYKEQLWSLESCASNPAMPGGSEGSLSILADACLYHSPKGERICASKTLGDSKTNAGIASQDAKPLSLCPQSLELPKQTLESASVDEQLSGAGLPNSIMHLIGTLAHSRHLAQQEVASSAGPMPLSTQIHEHAHSELRKSPANVPLSAPWQPARHHDRSCNSKSSSSGSQFSHMDTNMLPDLGLLRADVMFDEPKCTEDLDASQQIPHSLAEKTLTGDTSSPSDLKLASFRQRPGGIPDLVESPEEVRQLMQEAVNLAAGLVANSEERAQIGMSWAPDKGSDDNACFERHGISPTPNEMPASTVSVGFGARDVAVRDGDQHTRRHSQSHAKGVLVVDQAKQGVPTRVERYDRNELSNSVEDPQISTYHAANLNTELVWSADPQKANCALARETSLRNPVALPSCQNPLEEGTRFAAASNLRDVSGSKHETASIDSPNMHEVLQTASVSTDPAVPLKQETFGQLTDDQELWLEAIKFGACDSASVSQGGSSEAPRSEQKDSHAESVCDFCSSVQEQTQAQVCNYVFSTLGLVSPTETTRLLSNMELDSHEKELAIEKDQHSCEPDLGKCQLKIFKPTDNCQGDHLSEVSGSLKEEKASLDRTSMVEAQEKRAAQGAAPEGEQDKELEEEQKEEEGDGEGEADREKGKEHANKNEHEKEKERQEEEKEAEERARQSCTLQHTVDHCLQHELGVSDPLSGEASKLSSSLAERIIQEQEASTVHEHDGAESVLDASPLALEQCTPDPMTCEFNQGVSLENVQTTSIGELSVTRDDHDNLDSLKQNFESPTRNPHECNFLKHCCSKEEHFNKDMDFNLPSETHSTSATVTEVMQIPDSKLNCCDAVIDSAEVFRHFVLDLRLPGSTEHLSTLEIPQTEHPEQDPCQDDKSLESGPVTCEEHDIRGVRYSEEHHGQHYQTADVDAEEVRTAEEMTQVCQSQLECSGLPEHERRVSVSRNQAGGEPQEVQSPSECDDCACALREPSATPMLQCAQPKLATQSLHHNLVSLEQDIESPGRDLLGRDMEFNKTMEMCSGSDLRGRGSIELLERIQEPDRKLHSCSNVADINSAQPAVFEIQSIDLTQRLSTSSLQEDTSEQDSHEEAKLSETFFPEETQVLAGPHADLPECVASTSVAACQNAGAGVEPSIADTSASNHPAKTTITRCEPQHNLTDVEQIDTSTKTVCLRTLTKVKKVAEKELDDAIQKKNVRVLRGSIDRARKADVCAKKLRTAQKLVEETSINLEL